MTKVDWETSDDPQTMLPMVRSHVTARSLRLFAVACVRRIWNLLPDQTSREVVQLAEQFADCRVTAEELEQFWGGLPEFTLSRYWEADRAALWAARAARAVGQPSAWGAAQNATNAVIHAVSWAVDGRTPPSKASGDERSHHANLLRHIVGDWKRRATESLATTRPVAVAVAWRTPIVINLVEAIYEERQLPSGCFDNLRLGILADVLEESGCENAEMIAHLRQSGVHVRGCWAVDLVRSVD